MTGSMFVLLQGKMDPEGAKGKQMRLGFTQCKQQIDCVDRARMVGRI
jgi:hypothetical protein